MFEIGLFTFLSNAQTSAGDRVYPRKLKQGAQLPALVYFKVSGGINYVSNGQSGLETPRYQINCWAETYIAARALADEVKTLLSGYQGAMGNETVTAAFIEDDQDDDDPETEREMVRLDVIIHHQ
jgi:hypothetical protein